MACAQGTVDFHVDLAVYALLKRDECLGLCYAGDVLYVVVEQLHQVLVVFGVYLDKQRVGACGEMAFYNFADFLKFLYHFTVH